MKQHVQLPNDMTINEELTPKDLLVYVTIKKFINRNTYSCFPSLSTIVKKSGVSKKTVLKAINKLVKYNYIMIKKRGRSNLYVFNMYKGFEPFSYEFLDRTDITTEEKALIIAEQQYMYKDLPGYGKVTYTDYELSKKINMSYNSIVKYHKSLEKKGFLTTIRTEAKDSTTGITINEKIFNLNALGQAIIWILKKHEEDINDLKEKTSATAKDVDLLINEIQRLNKRLDKIEKKIDDEIVI